MKKVLSFIALIALIFVFAACGNTETESTQDTTGTKAPATTVSTDGDNKTEDTEDEGGNFGFASVVEGKEEYFQTLNCREYKGDELEYGTVFTNRYVIIKSYEDLCKKTAWGSDYPSDIFSDSYVLVLYTYNNFTYPEIELGFRNLRNQGGRITIDRYVLDKEYGKTSSSPVEQITYLKVPKEYVKNNIPDFGEMTVKRVKAQIYDTVTVSVDAGKYDNGTAWLLNPDELEGFLRENGIEQSLDWKRTCDCECGFYYCSSEYKILAIYLELAGTKNAHYNRPLGYGSLQAFEYGISITRNNMYVQNRDEKTAVLEFVAIHSSLLKEVGDTPLEITVKNVYHHEPVVSYRTGISMNNMATVEDVRYDYYRMLELGVYFGDSDLTTKNAYHIITSYEELLESVDNPFVSAELFNDNVIVVIKADTYHTSLINGIRNLYFGENGSLFATMEYSYNYEHDSYFPYNYSYIAVPKDGLNIKGQSLKGELKLTVNKAENESYYYSVKSSTEKYLAKDQMWVLDSHRRIESFESIHKDVTNLESVYYRGRVLLIYYGVLSGNAEFRNLSVVGGTLYLDIIADETKLDQKPCYYVLEIDKALFNGITEISNVKISKYTRNWVKREVGNEQVTESYMSFYSTRSSDGKWLQKTPDFESMLIDNVGDFLTVLTEYVRVIDFEVPDIDFESCYVVAYYTVHGCTGCPFATSFENARVGNGVLYIDMCDVDHWGNDALTGALHFIYIPKEAVTGEINKVVIVKGPNFLTP